MRTCVRQVVHESDISMPRTPTLVPSSLARWYGEELQKENKFWYCCDVSNVLSHRCSFLGNWQELQIPVQLEFFDVVVA